MVRERRVLEVLRQFDVFLGCNLDKMPVSGLPPAVEVTLESVLSINHLTSWKISSQGSRTTIVLRLSQNCELNEAAITTHQPDFQQTFYRKKPPCQLRRDKARSISRLTKASNNSTSLNLPTSHGKTFSDNATQCEKFVGLHNVPSSVSFFTDISSSASPCQLSPRADQLNTDSLSRQVNNDVNSLYSCQSEENVNSEGDSPECENDTSKQSQNQTFSDEYLISEFDDKLPYDKNLKPKLCDKSRNIELERIVLDTRYGHKELKGETDDLVLGCDLNTKDVRWFIKFDKKLRYPYRYLTQASRLSEDERNIQYWPSVNYNTYKHEIDFMHENLAQIMNAIRERLLTYDPPSKPPDISI